MSKVVYIFGAGASAHAGAPLMSNFLDVAEKLGRTVSPDEKPAFDLVFRAHSALQPLYAKARLPLDNVEALFAAFEMSGLCGKFPGLADDERARLIPSLKRVIAKTLDASIDFPTVLGREGGRVSAPVPYGDFVSLLTATLGEDRRRASLLTFNYDLALDYALHSCRLPINYCLTEEPRDKRIVLLKLHGSLNWISRVRDGGESAVPWLLSSYFGEYGFQWDLFGRPERVKLPILGHLRRFKPDGKDGEPCGEGATPFIVPPTWNKTRYHEGIASVWRAAARELAEAEHIAVVGYSLPETDMFFRYLYAIGTLGDARLKTFLLVDPDPSGRVERQFRDMLGSATEARFRAVKTDFASAVRQLADLATA